MKNMTIAANFSNVMVHNLTNGSIIELYVNSSTNSVSFNVAVPSVRIVGNYSLKADGIPIFRDVYGQGPFWMELKELQMNGTNSLYKDGNNFGTVYTSGIKLEFQNLFNGSLILVVPYIYAPCKKTGDMSGCEALTFPDTYDKLIAGAAVNRRLNAYGMELFNEIKPYFAAELGNVIRKIIDVILT